RNPSVLIDDFLTGPDRRASQKKNSNDNEDRNPSLHNSPNLIQFYFFQFVNTGCFLDPGTTVALVLFGVHMIRQLQSGEYRLYSRKKDPKTGKRRNLGTFKTRAAAEKHEREVQYFKRH